MARIKIDISEGILEVEGEEEFLREIYEDFKNRVKTEPGSHTSKAVATRVTPEPLKQKARKGTKTTSTSRKESYSLVKDLHLRGDDKDAKSLRVFFGDKKPSSAMEKTTVFVYYLVKVAGVDRIGIDHIYTCYKEVGEKVPTALRQNLLDTAHRKGTIDTSSLDNVRLTTRGENLVELDLPVQPKDK